MAGRGRELIAVATMAVATAASAFAQWCVMQNPDPSETQFGAVFLWPLIFAACYFVGGWLLARAGETPARILAVAVLTCVAAALVLTAFIGASEEGASGFAVILSYWLAIPGVVGCMLGSAGSWIIQGWGGWRDRV